MRLWAACVISLCLLPGAVGGEETPDPTISKLEFIGRVVPGLAYTAASQALRSLLHDPDAEVRFQALRALGRLNRPDDASSIPPGPAAT